MKPLDLGIVDQGGAAFSPTDIASIDGWWKFDEVSGLSDGDSIGQVDDSSGNGKHITQGTGANQPLWKENIQNGLAVGRFDGSNDYLVSTNFTAYGNDEWTLFWVGSSDTDNAYREIVHMGNNVSGQAFFVGSNTSGQWRCGRYGNDFYIITDPTVSTTTFTMGSFYFDTTVDAVYGRIDGAAATPASGSYALAITGDNIAIGIIYGYGQPWDGDVGEVIVYGAKLTAEQITNVETYLNNKWNIF